VSSCARAYESRRLARAIACAWLLVGTALLAPARAAADAGTQDQQAAEAEAGAGCAPLPGQTRCVAREAGTDAGRERLLVVPRLLLALPRLVVRVTTGVMLLGADVEDASHVTARADELFWNDRRTFGVLPAFYYESGIGPSAGARVVANDAFGNGETLRLRGGFGGIHEQFYDARLETDPDRGAQHFWLRMAFVRRDRYFFGVGNADQGSASAISPPVDAFAPPAAVRTHYWENEFMVRAVTDSHVGGPFRVYVTELWRIRKPTVGSGGHDDAPWIDDVYTDGSLVGLNKMLIGSYSELSLHFDSRVRVRSDVPDDVAWSGLLVNVWSGVDFEMHSVGQAYGRAGFDVQPFIDLFRGNRMLLLRLRGASVLGPLDEIAFVDLPTLGGSLFLRCYELGRFRGRATLLGSAEYRFPVQESLAAYVFVDAGRPYTSLSDLSLASLASLRVGYGLGLDIFGVKDTRLRVELASSIDGGLFLYLKLNTGDEETYNYW
jgi:hypothetical protein